MNSFGQLSKPAILAAIIFLSGAMVVRGQPSPAHSVDASGEGRSMVLQPIELDNVSLSFAIGHLAQRAHVNVIIDEQVQDWWDMRGYFGGNLHPEPYLSFHKTDMTAKRALALLVREYGLVMTDDPQTSVARITLTNQVVVIAPLDTNIFGNDKTPIPGKDKKLIPLIEFEDVPLTVAMENLARQAGINYILDPQIGYGEPDKNGQIKHEPVMNCYWENVTARQGLAAVLKNYGFTVNKDPASPVLLVRARNHLAHFVDATLLGNDTNVIPLIEFQDVPLTAALENLGRQANFNCRSNLGYGQEDKNGQIKSEPFVSIRWESVSAKEAFIAICDNYDFVLTRDPGTGAIEIKSDE